MIVAVVVSNTVKGKTRYLQLSTKTSLRANHLKSFILEQDYGY